MNENEQREVTVDGTVGGVTLEIARTEADDEAFASCFEVQVLAVGESQAVEVVYSRFGRSLEQRKVPASEHTQGLEPETQRWLLQQARELKALKMATKDYQPEIVRAWDEQLDQMERSICVEQGKMQTNRFVSGYWNHIFGEGTRDERECRFVFDRIDNKVSHLEILDGVKGWVASSEDERLDVEDSLKNANDGAIENPDDWGLDESNSMPDWAAPKPQATNEAGKLGASDVNDPVVMNPAWSIAHDEAAFREGWIISECWGSESGPWQVQRIDDPDECVTADGTQVPHLQSDDEAMKIVAAGMESHHIAAREFMRVRNPMEYEAIMRVGGKLVEKGAIDAELEAAAFSLATANESYLHGECHVFAIALSRASGWPLAAAVEYDHDLQSDALAHAFVVAPDGRIVDIKGVRTFGEVKQEFGGGNCEEMTQTSMSLEALCQLGGGLSSAELEPRVVVAMPIAHQLFVIANEQLASRKVAGTAVRTSERYVYAEADAKLVADQLLALGYKARVTTCRLPNWSSLPEAEGIAGYSVDVEMKASDPRIEWATGIGYRSAPAYPTGFAWSGWNPQDDRIYLLPLPSDTLEQYVNKLQNMVTKERDNRVVVSDSSASHDM